MESLIGGVVLDKELQRRAAAERDEAERRGWEQEHWRPTCAERDGAQKDEEAGGGRAARDEGGVDGIKRRRTREGVHGGDGNRSAATSGRRSAVDCGVGPADITTTDTLRGMIDDAMQLLGSMAHDADLAFGQTHV